MISTTHKSSFTRTLRGTTPTGWQVETSERKNAAKCVLFRSIITNHRDKGIWYQYIYQSMWFQSERSQLFFGQIIPNLWDGHACNKSLHRQPSFHRNPQSCELKIDKTNIFHKLPVLTLVSSWCHKSNKTRPISCRRQTPQSHGKKANETKSSQPRHRVAWRCHSLEDDAELQINVHACKPERPSVLVLVGKICVKSC